MTTLYQWNKYNNNRVAHTGYTTTYTSGSWSTVSTGNPGIAYGSSSYTLNTSTGVFSTAGSNADTANNGSCYWTSGNTVYQGSGYQSSGKWYYNQSAMSSVARQSPYTYYTDSEGSLATILFEPYDAHTDGVKNADGYWYERISAIPDPATIIFPKGGETLVNQQTLYWSPATDADTDQSLLQYEVQLSTDNGSTWKDLIALTQANVTNLTHDFSTESETTTGLVRVRGYDGTNYGQWYQSPSTFTIVHRVKVGEIHTSGLTLPIYDPNTGLDNKNQLRITDKNNNVASFELVDVTDGKASPFRVQTTEGIKAIANA